MSMIRPRVFIAPAFIAAFMVLPAFVSATNIVDPTLSRGASESVLYVGSRGKDVSELQRELNVIFATSTPLPVTGYFGPMTERVVRRFQSEEGVVSRGDQRTTGYGRLGPKTRAALRLSLLARRCTWETKPSRQACLEEFYRTYAKERGASEALRLIGAHIARERYFDGSCHAPMHEIGHAAAQEYKTLGVAFTLGTPLCQNGYYHGVVEEYLRERPIVSVTPEELRGFCAGASLYASTTQPILNCVHGVGHALVYMTKDDLPAALSRCVDFVTETERGECMAGAFMQDSFMGSTTAVKTKALQGLTSACSQALFDGGKCWIAEGARVIASAQMATSSKKQ